MNTNTQTSKVYFSTLKIMHMAMIAGQLIFAGIAIFITQNGFLSPDNQQLNTLLTIIVPILIIGGFVGSIVIYNKRISVISNSSNIKEMLTVYRTALVTRYAMLEAPSFFAIIAFILTSNILFMGLSAMVIISFIMISPSKEKAIDELKLDRNNQALISDPNALVV